ncbi:acyl-CoA thioesterase [soil metagenome]
MRDGITHLRFLAAPGDLSAGSGTVPAGRILEWIDRAGYACAVGWSARYCVTAYVGDITFRSTIRPGNLVELRATLLYTGRTSMHIRVEVHASRPEDPNPVPSASCLLVLIAKDDQGQSVPVPAWVPRNVKELELADAAQTRIAPRRGIQEAMLKHSYRGGDPTNSAELRFLAAPGDANWDGRVHGGIAMRWMMEAGYACATSWCAGRAIAVYSGGVQFIRPIEIGQVVEVSARLILTTARSMHVGIRVHAANATSPTALALCTQAVTVFVQLGPDGKSRHVREFVPHTPADEELIEHASDLMIMRRSLAPI